MTRGSCPERSRDKLALTLPSVICFVPTLKDMETGQILPDVAMECERAHMPTHDRALLPGTLTAEHRTTTRFWVREGGAVVLDVTGGRRVRTDITIHEKSRISVAFSSQLEETTREST